MLYTTALYLFAIFICSWLGAMPIPLDLANLASLSIEEDLHLGTLDFANLNASSGQPDEPVPGAALVTTKSVESFQLKTAI